MHAIDLNSDLGESFGAYTLGMDEKLMEYITSANVACGWHAGDPLVMQKTIRAAAKNGVAVGAHPGYPDLMGFGRREIKITPEEAYTYVLYQLGALDAFARTEGVKIQHVKPHGALYNMAGKDYELARAVCEAIADVNPRLILMAQAGSQMQKAAEEMHLKMAREIFADRAYEEDGSLVARNKPGAMITDENEAIERVITMVRQGKVAAITGKEIPIQADSVCVHGDGEKALLFVKKLREAFLTEGIQVRSLTI